MSHTEKVRRFVADNPLSLLILGNADLNSFELVSPSISGPELDPGKRIVGAIGLVDGKLTSCLCEPLDERMTAAIAQAFAALVESWLPGTKRQEN
jgi:hypothetical protein